LQGQGDDSIYGTNVETHTTTTASGIYHLLSLPPGRYELRVEHDGFRPAAGDFREGDQQRGNRMVVYDPATRAPTRPIRKRSSAIPLRTT
jgi:hypothetical protein